MNNVSDELFELETVLSLCDTLFGLEVDHYKGLEQAAVCLRNHLKTLPLRAFVLRGTTVQGALALPCATALVRAVAAAPAPGDARSFLRLPGVRLPDISGVSYGEGQALPVDTAVFRRLDSLPAELLDYEYRDGCVHLAGWEPGQGERQLEVAYRTVRLDAMGYPLVTHTQAEACAHFIHLVETRKAFYRREATESMVTLAEEDFFFALQRARTGDGLSENAMNNVLDAMTSMNRKRFGLPLRP